ncbi:MAG TPA: hypothetical protein DCG49_11500 [Ruminococcus sp.]|nr:hypothetical protein [Ruminococcus sp.]
MKKYYAMICAAMLAVLGTIPAFAAENDTETPEMPIAETTVVTWDTMHCCPPDYNITTSTMTEYEDIETETTQITTGTDEYLQTEPEYTSTTTGYNFSHVCAWFTTYQWKLDLDPGESDIVEMCYQPVQNVGHEPVDVYVALEDDTIASFTYDGLQTVTVKGLKGGQTNLILRDHYDPDTGHYEQEVKIPVTVTGGEGDANCDGSADVGDAVLVSRFISEDPDAVIPDHGQDLADVDGAAGLSSTDVVCMLRKLAWL